MKSAFYIFKENIFVHQKKNQRLDLQIIQHFLLHICNFCRTKQIDKTDKIRRENNLFNSSGFYPRVALGQCLIFIWSR